MHPVRYNFYVVLFVFQHFTCRNFVELWPLALGDNSSIYNIVMYTTVFNESRWPAKLAGYFTKTSLLLFFGNFPSLSSWVLTSCHWIKVKKPKFSDVCFLSKHSNFCPRMLEMHCKRPRLQFFFSETCAFAMSFFFLHQSFCHLPKILLKTIMVHAHPDIQSLLLFSSHPWARHVRIS